MAHWKRILFFKAFSCQDYDFYFFIFTNYNRPIVESATQVQNPRPHPHNIDITENVQRFKEDS